VVCGGSLLKFERH